MRGRNPESDVKLLASGSFVKPVPRGPVLVLALFLVSMRTTSLLTADGPHKVFSIESVGIAVDQDTKLGKHEAAWRHFPCC